MPAITFDKVSKRFTLHRDKPRSIEDLVVKGLKRRQISSKSDDFWALRDLSFQIPHGQTVGLIGPNGAGKSTALKLIARVYEPTSGKIEVNGRLNALIELSAGFHEELTGRENIYLSAALLGVSRREIQAHFDEIVAFSELEEFIDLQVKHYSTGMGVRLGFAIASVIESDILLIDEVLAVGDANFQRKCLERIAEIRECGTTIFYVSHTAAQVERLCDRALLVYEGRLVEDGSPAEALKRYEQLREQARQERARQQATPAALAFFNLSYLAYEVPDTMRVDSRYEMRVTFRNQSQETWRGRAGAGSSKVSLGYHWLDRWGTMYQWFGVATALPQDVVKAESLTMSSPIVPPSEPGVYRLEIDMVAEGQGWFSRQGCSGPQIEVKVLPHDGSGPSTAHELQSN